MKQDQIYKQFIDAVNGRIDRIEKDKEILYGK